MDAGAAQRGRPVPTAGDGVPRLTDAAAAPRPEIVVADDDLFFSARIAAALEALGYRPVVVRTADAFAAHLAAGPAAAILNLAAHRFDAVQAIRAAKTDAATALVPLLGFCGHADAARQSAACEAGCDLIATNGAVSARLDRLLASLLPAPAVDRGA